MIFPENDAQLTCVCVCVNNKENAELLAFDMLASYSSHNTRDPRPHHCGSDSSETTWKACGKKLFILLNACS